jgi:hypothetical protein
LEIGNKGAVSLWYRRGLTRCPDVPFRCKEVKDAEFATWNNWQKHSRGAGLQESIM